ncbi:MAG: VTT domain-containing protein [Candidatus Diapherotrites archaeon]|nr:VTT domain-containing protein [Candidatus Diapherotrites archaeon]
MAIFVLADYFSKNPKIFETIILTYGLPGVFIATIIANATILLPVPVDIFIVLFGQIDFYHLGILSPFILGLTVGLGAAIGELSGYVIGYFSIKSLQEFRKQQFSINFDEIKERVQNQGTYFIALAALIPFPFDIIGLLCGVMRFDVRKFFLAVWVGKTGRYIILSYAGYFGITWLRAFFHI